MLALIPLFPFVGFLINAFFGRRLSKAASGGVACLAMIASFARVGRRGVADARASPGPCGRSPRTCISGSRRATSLIDVAFRVDPLASVMILVVTGIGSLIHIYSTAYMHEETDSEYARYFSYLNLFAAFMLVLVLGTTFPVLFVGWEGVGLCSYLLIGFWHQKQSAIDAGKKAFVVNRIGDFAFILGMLLLWTTFGTLDFQNLAAQVGSLPPEAGFGVIVDRDAAAVHRRDRQVRADPAVRLAAGRHGRPDAGLRADPCRDDGDGGRVHDRAERRAVQPRARRRCSSSRSSAASPR